MKNRHFLLLNAMWFVVFGILTGNGKIAAQSKSTYDKIIQKKQEVGAQIPSYAASSGEFGFVENKGQVTDLDGNLLPEIAYLLNSNGMKVQLRKDGFSYDTWLQEWVDKPIEKTGENSGRRQKARQSEKVASNLNYHRIDVQFKGANPNPVLEALEQAPELIHIINSKGDLTVRHFRKIVYRELYPGIDLEFVIKDDEKTPIEYNFIVRPGADPSLISLEYKGSDQIKLSDGRIKISLSHGLLEENIPASWTGDSDPVDVNYLTKGSNTFGFRVGAYDRSKTLTIDPTPRLVWGTFYQASGTESLITSRGKNLMGMDPEGNMYLVFATKSNAWQTTSGAFQASTSGLSGDLFIAKFNKSGKRVASTFFGGTYYDSEPVLKVGPDGIYITCSTYGNLPGGIMGTIEDEGNQLDYAVLKFRFNLGFVWGRYIGGGFDENFSIAMAVDNAGNVTIFGQTPSTNFPAAGGLSSSTQTGSKLCAARLSSTGSVIWSGIFANPPSTSREIFNPIQAETDKNGNIYLLMSVYFNEGSSAAVGLATAGSYNSIQPSLAAPTVDKDDIILLKYSPLGAKLWGTWISGSNYDYGDNFAYGADLELDQNGNPWVTFISNSDLPTTADAYLRRLPENYSLYDLNNVAKQYLQQYSADGKSLLYSTLYAGEKDYGVFTVDITLDTLSGSVYLCFTSYDNPYSTNFEDLITDCAHQAWMDGIPNPEYGVWHFAKLGNWGRTREWGTVYGIEERANIDLEFYDGRLYMVGEVTNGSLMSRVQDATTSDAEQPTPDALSGFLMASFDEGILPDSILASANSILPATQTACIGGLTQMITGSKVAVTGPGDYNNVIVYQWQQAPMPTGPWTDIIGERGKDLTPEPRDEGPVYFRRLASVPGPTCSSRVVNISNVSELTISSNVAPKANAGGAKFYTCSGNSITLNGSGSGGIPPYTYEWFIGGDLNASSTTTELTDAPTESTLYTFKVTDAVGCFGIDQSSVQPVVADAGDDKPFCAGQVGVQIGTTPIQGTPLVRYSWAPSTEINCTTCGQPIVNPASAATYSLTVSVTEKSGEVCTMTDQVTVTPVAAPGDRMDFAGPDQTVCQGEMAVMGLAPVSGYKYTWAPGLYVVDNQSGQTTYDAGTNVVKVPLRYAVTAEKDGCTFVDFMSVFTEYFQITPRNRTICVGPEWFYQEDEAGEKNSPNATFTWEKVSGDAEIEVLATKRNGADAYVRLKPGSGNSVTFRRKTSLNGKDCYSFNNTLEVCAGGGGGGCIAEVRVLGGSGCPLPGGGYKVYAKYIPVGDYKFKWSPSWAFDNDTLPTPTLITANNGVNISVICTNRYDTSIVCKDTLYVNDPALTLPIFQVSDTNTCPNVPIALTGYNVAGYSYLWNNTTGMANPATDRLVANPMVTIANDQQYIVRVEDVGTGCFVYDTMTVNVSPVSVDAGPDLQACASSIVTIGAPAPPGTNYTYNWNPSNVPWKPDGTRGDTMPNPSMLFGGIDLTMIVTATNSIGCTAKDTVLLKAPTGGDLIPTLPTPSDICPGGSVTIGTPAIAGAVYEWTPTTGLACATCSTTSASPSSTTTYTLKIKSCGPEETETVTVTVKDAPQFNLINRTNCPSTPLAIGIGASGNTASLSNVKSYSWSPGDNLSCVDCPNPNVTCSRPTLYTLTVQYNNGCSVTKSCTITPQAGLTANAGRDGSICPGEEIQIGMDPVAGSTYAWSPAAGLSNANIANPTASPTETTTYKLTVTKGGCTSTDEVLVKVKALPELNFVGNTTICRGGDTEIGVGAGSNISYQWSPLTGVVSPNSPTTFIRPEVSTKYKLTQVNLLTGCSDSKQVLITVNEPKFEIDASVAIPIEVCEGTPTTLPLKVYPTDGNYVYYWESPLFLQTAAMRNPVTSAPFSSTYKVYVTNTDNNCILTAEVPVTVLPLDNCPSYDYGDVPLSYEKNGLPARHVQVNGLKMGDLFDSETAPQSVFDGQDANGDDQPNFDDEDAVIFLSNLHPRKDSFNLIASGIYNDTFPVAYLVAWIDYDRNGCFDEDERRIASVVKDTTGPGTVQFDWSGFNPNGILPFGQMYIRLRLTGDLSGGWDQNPLAYGTRESGEVEDYNVYIYPTLPFADSKVVEIGNTVSGDLSLNDKVPPGTTYLSAVISGTNPTTQLPVINPNGNFTFSPTLPGVYNFNVPVNDGVTTVNVKLTITVLSKNNIAPVASTDIGITRKNTPVTINTLHNDFAGTIEKRLVPASVKIVTPPLYGTAVVDTLTGNITYTPNSGYVGPDNYFYSVNDDMAPTPGISSACQSIQVIADNSENTVLASNDQLCAMAGTYNTGNVLANDVDPDGDGIFAVPMTVTTSNYTFVLKGDGSFSFVTAPYYTEPVVITYAMYDASSGVARDTAMICFYLKTILGDRVWDDKDRDGLQDANESGFEGMRVTLHTCVNDTISSPTPISESVTNENGNYFMPIPPAGDYVLLFDTTGLGARNYRLTIPNIEKNGRDSLDSDANFFSGMSRCFHVSSADTSLTNFDAGIFKDADGDFQPDCFDKDTTIIDPLGYLYCENTGEVLDSGLVTATGPGNIYWIFDGSTGFYQFLVDAEGLYTIQVTNPPRFPSSGICLVQQDTFVAPQDSLVNLGSSDADSDDFLDDPTCATNVFYVHMYLTPGSIVAGNNFPMTCQDLGDLPAPYITLADEDGPRHAILQQPLIYLGDIVDAEPDGQPEAMAGMMTGGDDGNIAGQDDEDGVQVMPLLTLGEDAPIQLKVTNLSSKPALLAGFLDLNGDGDFNDAGETKTSIVAAGYVGLDTLTFAVPLEAPFGQKIGLRFRISTQCEGEERDSNTVITSFTGSLTSTDPTFNRPLNNNSTALCNPGTSATYYDVFTFKVSATGNYTFDAGGTPGNTFAIIGRAPFNPSAPCVGFIQTGNNEAGDDPRNTVMLTAGVEYVYVFTTNQPSTVASYDISISSNVGDVLIPAGTVISADGPADTPTGVICNGEIEDYMVSIPGFDYGDLPDTYNTEGPDSPPAHVVIPELKLGASVDAEVDGLADAMAGSMGGGDDGDTGVYVIGTSTPAGDDEDGVMLVSPMIPGSMATFMVTAMNMLESAAVLQAWVDFNGNGTFENNEQLITGSFAVAGPGAYVPVGGLSGTDGKLSFMVPSDAVFADGNAMVRFRLSPDGGLAADQQTGTPPYGEIEDYKFPLAKVGNLVFEDYNFNGSQDGGEPGINGVTVTLVWGGPDGTIGGGDDVTYPSVQTSSVTGQGEYYFCGLIDGKYKLIVQTPEDMTPTRWNVASTTDTLDSDGPVVNMDLTMVMDTFTVACAPCLPTNEDGTGDNSPNDVGTFPDLQTDETHDFGFALLDYGDLPESGNGSNFNTSMAEGGAFHTIYPGFKLGASVDAERDGTPSADAKGDGGDEDGIRFLTPLVPGNDACIEVTSMNPLGQLATLQGWMDWDNDGVLEAGEALNFVSDDIPTGTSATKFTFYVPKDAIFNEGQMYARFRLSPDGGFGPDGPVKYDPTSGISSAGEVEDYVLKFAKIGNLVWEDRNWNGLQDETEEDLGINGIPVALIWGGDNGILETSLATAGFPLTAVGDDKVFYDTTATYTYIDGSTKGGIYYFCGLIPGTYDVVVLGPKDLTPTRVNPSGVSQEEDLDSDGLETSRDLATQRTLVHSGSITLADEAALCKLFTDEEGIGDQDLSNLLDVNDVGPFPDNQVDQRFDFGFVALDYGDLPQSGPRDTFNTTLSENGPRHIVKPEFYLGACVDAEIDGTPEEFAGSKAYGGNSGDDADDTDPLTWKQGTPGADDENGIRFLTPLVPGYEAKIEVRYVLPDNFDGPDGFLNAWIDFDGDGVLESGEKLKWTKVNNSTASVEPITGALELERINSINGGDRIVVCFTVPSTASYFEGNVYARFRLSEDPRLGPDGILPSSLGYSNGKIPCGEVEDYFMKLSKVGNLVWEDRNYNGTQDFFAGSGNPSEPPIKGVAVQLTYAGPDGVFGNADDMVYRDTTDAQGLYAFCGLIGSDVYDPSGADTALYRITAFDPVSMTPTFDWPFGAKSDVIDQTNSDGDDTHIDDRQTSAVFSISNPMGLCVNEDGMYDRGPLGLGGFPDMQFDEVFDFGYVGFDYGDLAVSGTNYVTLRDSMSALYGEAFGARHAIQPKLFLGSVVDGELNGQPDGDAGSKAGGDDDSGSGYVKGTGADDETGVRLLTPLIPGEIALIKVTYCSQDTVEAGGYSNRTAYLRGFIDFNGDGDLNDVSDMLSFVAIGGSQGSLSALSATNNPSLPGGIDSMRVLAFRVPTDAVYRDGVAYMRFRLSWEQGVGPDNTAYHQDGTAPYVVGGVYSGSNPYPRGEVEDYAIPLAKVGNLSWYDHDVRGDQNETDYVDTLQLVLVWGGVNENNGTFDAVGYKTTMAAAGSVTDVLYNLSIVPSAGGVMPPNSNDTPGQIVRTNGQGLYSFQGLIPGNYYLVPLKYLQADSGSYVNAWPKHRVLTLMDNLVGDDVNDSDGMPGAAFTVSDGNTREPEVCVGPQPTGENGRNDATDASAMIAMHPTGKPFPDNQYNQTIDFGWVDEPNIEANLDIVGVNYPTSQTCGHFNVIMHVCIKNPTEVALDSLQALLNLSGAYGAAFRGNVRTSIVDSSFVTTPAGVRVRKAMGLAKTALQLNPGYNGSSDTRLLLPLNEQGSFYLPGDSIVCIRVEFEIDPSKTAAYPWSSQAQVSGRAVGFRHSGGGVYVKQPLTDYFLKSPNFGGSIIVRDLSDEIDDPMSGDMIAFEGMVADRGFNGTYSAPFGSPNVTGRDKYLDENNMTVQNDECWLQTKWNGGVKNVNITLDENCSATVNADLLVPNHIDACGFEKYPEGSYYQVIIFDKETDKTLWASVWRTPFDVKPYLGRRLAYEVKSVSNHCHPIWGDLTFEDKTPPVLTCPLDTDRKAGSSYGFVCTDIDSVLNVKASWNTPGYAYYTGKAIGVDNCTEAILDQVSDRLINYATCSKGDTVSAIERTFHLIDLAGNVSTCVQMIYFKRPQIVLPECKVAISALSTAGDTVLKPGDLVVKYGLLDAVPYFFNGAGRRIHLTDKAYCSFAVSYTDKFEYETGSCGRKIIRTWSIMDWCYGMTTPYPNYLVVPGTDNACYGSLSWVNKEYKWEQLIVVGDETAPVVRTIDSDKDGYRGTGYVYGASNNPYVDNLAQGYDAGDYLEFSTGPVNCTGSFLFDRSHFTVEEESGWCYEVEVMERKPVLDLNRLPTGEIWFNTLRGITITGNCNSGYLISGVPMPKDSSTTYFVRLRVANACYRETIILIPIRVVDKIAPVMKCTDQLNVSFDNVGVGSVSVDQVDVGSTDNCSKLTWRKLRRPVSTGDCRAQWLTVKDFVDVNGNKAVDVNDYIDENRNKSKDALEGFSTHPVSGALMSPYLNNIPVFCCDGDSVMVELWGEDKAGNRNFCWNWIRLEDKTSVDYLLPFNQTYTCAQERPLIELLSKAGTYAEGTPEYAAAVTLFKEDVLLLRGHLCSPVTKQIVVTPSMKCNGPSTITVGWRLTKQAAKGAVLYTTPTRTLTVLPVNEYNIMFPADVTGSCTNLRDTANVIDGGELGCDILAVLVQDKRYNGAMVDGRPAAECYKIFRTFTVINWCQYTESCNEPMNWAVVVPRDIAGRPGAGSFNGVNVLVRDPDAINPSSQPRYYFEDAAGTVPYPGARVASKELGNAGDKVAQSSEEVTSFTFNNGADPRTSSSCPTPNGLFSWMFTQYIFVHDDVAPQLKLELSGTPKYDKAKCSSTQTVVITASDTCSATELQTEVIGGGATGLATERVILVPQNGSPIDIKNGIDAGGVDYGDVTVTNLLSGDSKGTNSWTYEGKNLPDGRHELRVVVRDDCGNLSKQSSIYFEVGDNVGTAPICINGLSTNLIANVTGGARSATIWATDFRASDVYDCNGQGTKTDPDNSRLKEITAPANYFVYMDKDGNGKFDAADGIDGSTGAPLSLQTSITITCEQLNDVTPNPVGGSKSVLVRVYTRDGKGNWAWCETFVTVDNASQCPPKDGSSSIAGAINTETKVQVEGVEVNLSGKRAMSYLTTSIGQYGFNNLEAGYDYTVTPQLDRNPMNGVSTMDLVMIVRHILGQTPLNSPYKLIAADINNSKTITTMDLVQLRRVILGVDGKFQNNTSWRFVDAGYKFPDPSNPWKAAFPEVLSINDLGSPVQADFVAVKIGDVNGSALGTNTVRTNGTFRLNIGDMEVKAGTEVRIPISADLSEMEGYQFTLGLDRDIAELVDIEYGVMQAEHFGVFAKEGLITASWNGKGAKAEGEVLFTLVLKAKSDAGSLSELLNVNSRVTVAEAYTKAGDYQAVGLAFGAQTGIVSTPMLYQNIPNPFAGETVIGFNLVKGGEAILTVSDVQGRVLRVIRGEYGAGYQQVRLRSDELPSGVLQYTLTSGDFTATRRMVVGK